MKRSLTIYLTVAVAAAFTTGCWDATELNDRSLWAATAVDVGKTSAVSVSGQVIIPSKFMSGGTPSPAGAGPAFFVVQAEGKSLRDAVQTLQTKVSHKIFASHRQAVIFGEEMAREGLKGVMDEMTRSPDVKLRTGVFVVKNGTGEDFLKLTSPIDKTPPLAALREDRYTSGSGDLSFLQFLSDATGESTCPTITAGEIRSLPSLQGSQDTDGNDGFQIVGTAVFDRNLKMVGFLNMDETSSMRWIRGELRTRSLTEFIPHGNGSVSLELTKVKSKINPTLSRNKLGFDIFLSGSGIIKENKTTLDLSNPQNVRTVEGALSKKTADEILQQVQKVQELYGTDIYGFGESIHRKYPYQWKALKKHWKDSFSRADVRVHVTLKVRQIGLSGPTVP